jgi:hypothetical protein
MATAFETITKPRFPGVINNRILSTSNSPLIFEGKRTIFFQKTDSVSKLCTKIERGLNKLSYFPICSSFFSIPRIIYAQALFISSLAMAIISGVGWFLNGDISSKERMINWIKYSVHADLNFIRSVIEFIPGVGNTLCYGYDFVNFRFEYF